MLRKLLKVSVLILIVVASLSFVTSASAQTNIFTDFTSFDAVTGSLIEIDFEDFPGSYGESSLPNPLSLSNGVAFSSPYNMHTGFCSSPTCSPDPDNSSGGNIGLFLSVDSTINFPAGTGGVLLVIEGLGDTSYAVEVTDFGGNTVAASGQGVSYGISYLGFTSPSGIQSIKISSVGPTSDCPQSPCGPIFLTAIFVELNDPDITLKVWSDLVTDVTQPNTDIIYGSANIFGALVDLRVQFLEPPFSTSNSQTITWCFDIDQNVATGNACDFASSGGADRTFTLTGGPNALSGNNFSFSGALSDFDPCALGSFNWNTNVLRLVFPTSLLPDDGILNYAVRSKLGITVEKAPASVNFGQSGNYFTSEGGDYPFSGSPLCSFKQDTSTTIMPQIVGHVEYFPELNEIFASSFSIQSSYFKTTEVNRQFRLGFLEFNLPVLQHPVVNAILVYQDDLRIPNTTPYPTIIHDLSYYQPADLAINTADYNRPTLFLGSIDTDWNWPQQTFSVDVTDLVRQFEGNSLGFRIKLAADPDYNEIGNFGESFGALNNEIKPPHLVVQFVDAQTTITPTMASTLVYTDVQGNVTLVLAEANTVTQTTELLYINQAASAAANSVSASTLTKANLASAAGVFATDSSYYIYLPIIYTTKPANLVMVRRPFTLDGYRDGAFTSSSILQKSISVTLQYTDNEVSKVNENSLQLKYWNGSQWVDAACGPYERYADENKLSVSICNLDEFALFGTRKP